MIIGPDGEIIRLSLYDNYQHQLLGDDKDTEQEGESITSSWKVIFGVIKHSSASFGTVLGVWAHRYMPTVFDDRYLSTYTSDMEAKNQAGCLFRVYSASES